MLFNVPYLIQNILLHYLHTKQIPVVGLPEVAGGSPDELSRTGTITGVIVDVCNFFM